MNRIILFLAYIFSLGACSESENPSPPSPVNPENPILGEVTDIEGNKYVTVEIDDQIWMAENLNVSTFRNGDPIKQARTNEEWSNAYRNYEPAWCYLDNKSENGPKYGKLYNWFAVSDPRGLTPEGWEVPFTDEWENLSNYLGGNIIAGKKLKSEEGWEIGGNGTDDVSFKALPAEFREPNGSFGQNFSSGQVSYWWPSMPSFSRHSWYFGVSSSSDNLTKSTVPQGYGHSIRGIKRKKIYPPISGPEVGEIADIDGNIYKTVKIGTQTWMAENLKTTKFSNGDNIQNVTNQSQWENTIIPAWTYQNNNELNDVIHGKLYNWFVANDTRNSCPIGWKVPTEDDFKILINHLGGEGVAGGKLKQEGNSNWFPPNIGATNQSKFSGLPSAYRYDYGDFDDFGYGGGFWVKDEVLKWYYLRYDNTNFPLTDTGSKNQGISIRCIKE